MTIPDSLTRALPGQRVLFDSSRTAVIGVLEGEGVGREVIPITLSLLNQLTARTNRHFELRLGGVIGKPALEAHGSSLTGEVVEFCRSISDVGGAVLCGPGGGRFVYDLRSRFDLFCKFTPLRPTPALSDTGVLRHEALEGVDIVAVRENVSGMYFGEWGVRPNAAGGTTAFHHSQYDEEVVERILKVAMNLACQRSGRLSLTVKRGGLPSISRLWEEKAMELAQPFGLQVRILDIDNAVYQLIANPRDFDVVVSPNMFGDVLADCGSVLIGSRGMSYSGNFSPGGFSVYQTGHGSAWDIAGQDMANPVGQIQSLAMLLRESFDWPAGARALESAVATTLAQGYRTRDIAGPASRIVGTRELGSLIGATLSEQLVGTEL